MKRIIYRHIFDRVFMASMPYILVFSCLFLLLSIMGGCEAHAADLVDEVVSKDYNPENYTIFQSQQIYRFDDEFKMLNDSKPLPFDLAEEFSLIGENLKPVRGMSTVSYDGYVERMEYSDNLIHVRLLASDDTVLKDDGSQSGSCQSDVFFSNMAPLQDGTLRVLKQNWCKKLCFKTFSEKDDLGDSDGFNSVNCNQHYIESVIEDASFKKPLLTRDGADVVFTVDFRDGGNKEDTHHLYIYDNGEMEESK